jgi:hypothetical protein
LKEARSRLPGWKFLHINTHKRASPVARMKVQRYCCKLFLTTVKITVFHINTKEIHPAYRGVSPLSPRLQRSRLKKARSRLPGWKFLHINTRKRASPVAGMKVQRYRCHPAYQTVSLNGPARLLYKQALSHNEPTKTVKNCLGLEFHSVNRQTPK